MIDETILLKFWEDEQDTPQWFKDSALAWKIVTKDEFRKFCEGCYRIYDLKNAALYVEKVGTGANIHVSILRGKQIDIEKLIPIRTELLLEFESIFGFVNTRNHRLRRICEQLGMRYRGLKIFKGSSHGKVFEWKCYSIERQELYASKLQINIVNFA